MTIIRIPIAERFWPKVNKTDTCWFWTAALDSDGYGMIGIGGRHGGNGKAHRVSFEMVHGPLPKGVPLLHNCPGGDNRNCVNPEHLRLGTPAENMADTIAKGRYANGNTAKTHCKRGHEFTPENTKMRNEGRTCMACAAIAHRLKYPLRVKPATTTGRTCKDCELREPEVRFPKAGRVCMKCEYVKAKAKRGAWNKVTQANST